MTYLAPSDSELTLACWAINAVGRQDIPCLIHIIPASKFFCFVFILEQAKEYHLKSQIFETDSYLVLKRIIPFIYNAYRIIIYNILGK